MSSDSNSGSLTPAEANSKKASRDARATGDAVRRVSDAEKAIAGAVGSGVLDTTTQQELMGNLASAGNRWDQRANIADNMKSRLDNIVAGKDPTVNDRVRIQSQLQLLADRPGRRGLLTSG